MSNEQLNAVEAFDIGQLRKAANLLGIKADKHWRKEDFIEAIQTQQAQEQLVNAVFDSSTGPKPGYARVVIHRDPTPNHRNGPIHLGVNGRIIAVPRGGEFDIPIPYVEVLKNAVTVVTEQTEQATKDNPSGSYREEPRTSYPFQVVAVTPGPFQNQNDQRAAKYARRWAFMQANNAWPTDGELKEFEKVLAAKRVRDIENGKED